MQFLFYELKYLFTLRSGHHLAIIAINIFLFIGCKTIFYINNAIFALNK
jgi:hypothetical protein